MNLLSYACVCVQERIHFARQRGKEKRGECACVRVREREKEKKGGQKIGFRSLEIESWASDRTEFLFSGGITLDRISSKQEENIQKKISFWLMPVLKHAETKI